MVTFVLQADGLSGEVQYTGPIKAPVAKGTKLAQLIIHRPNLPDQTVDLLAAADIGPAGFIGRLTVALSTLRSRYMGS